MNLLKKFNNTSEVKELETDTLLGKLKTISTINTAKEQMNTSKLASRKLWVTIGGATLVTFASFLLLSMGVSEEITTQLVGWTAKILLGYTGAQGLVDVAKAIQSGKDLASKAQD